MTRTAHDPSGHRAAQNGRSHYNSLPCYCPFTSPLPMCPNSCIPPKVCANPCMTGFMPRLLYGILGVLLSAAHVGFSLGQESGMGAAAHGAAQAMEERCLSHECAEWRAEALWLPIPTSARATLRARHSASASWARHLSGDLGAEIRTTAHAAWCHGLYEVAWGCTSLACATSCAIACMETATSSEEDMPNDGLSPRCCASVPPRCRSAPPRGLWPPAVAWPATTHVMCGAAMAARCSPAPKRSPQPRTAGGSNKYGGQSPLAGLLMQHTVIKPDCAQVHKTA